MGGRDWKFTQIRLCWRILIKTCENGPSLWLLFHTRVWQTTLWSPLHVKCVWNEVLERKPSSAPSQTQEIPSPTPHKSTNFNASGFFLMFFLWKKWKDLEVLHTLNYTHTATHSFQTACFWTLKHPSRFSPHDPHITTSSLLLMQQSNINYSNIKMDFFLPSFTWLVHHLSWKK